MQSNRPNLSDLLKRFDPVEDVGIAPVDQKRLGRAVSYLIELYAARRQMSDAGRRRHATSPAAKQDGMEETKSGK